MGKDSSRLYTVAISLNSVEQTFSAAENLLTHAGSAPVELQPSIAAGASLALAASLEQAVFSALSSFKANLLAATSGAAEHGDDFSRIEHCRTLWSRVSGLPSMLSEGVLRLDPSDRDVKALKELVNLRNDMMHVDEAALSLSFRLTEGKPGSITLEPIGEEELWGTMPEVTAEVDENGNVSFRFASPTNPWTFLTLIDAHRCRKAVRRYIDDIVDCPDDSLKPGSSGLLRLQ